jgi:hypothetical protein
MSDVLVGIGVGCAIVLFVLWPIRIWWVYFRRI